ncbi:MAG TPA: septal ring lytic transglycosylase RlpA family protein [Solirubrobacteraceae bacterium]|nr:septal ring lytic transglycosylase RlpA family protein [Solirubrobacteraceae bacterium]
MSKPRTSRPSHRQIRLLAAAMITGLAAWSPLGEAQATAAPARSGGAAAPALAEPQPAASEGQAGAAGTASVVTVSEGPLEFHLRSIVMLGERLPFGGSAHGLSPGEVVLLEGAATPSGPWSTLARARLGAHGRFHARWRAPWPGHLYLRARAARAQSMAAGASAGAVAVVAYSPALATIYGPGFYGRLTACGLRMSRALLGVANRSLPCGTLLELTYAGRTLTVPVVDRGPYAHGASFDLTAHTAALLGATSTVRIGVLPLSALLAPAPGQPLEAEAQAAGGTGPW